jgi:hypothetical protein
MKNIYKLFVVSSIIFGSCIVNPLRAQTNLVSVDSIKSMPVDVQVILKKSCFGCHAEPGKTMALSRVNFTKWNEYTAEKQASKSRAMCKEVTKGKMPPKKFKENNPEAIPTADELKILCNWVATMQAVKQ